MDKCEEGLFKALFEILEKADSYTRQLCNSSECTDCLSRELGVDQCHSALTAKYLMDNGVIFREPAVLLIRESTEGLSAENKAKGWYRRRYLCPTCHREIFDEMRDGQNRVFGFGTVLKGNSVPRCCPGCGTRVYVEKTGP